LEEILAEAMKSNRTSLNVLNEYKKLTKTLGAEFKILLQIKPEEIARVSGERVAEGIQKVRKGEILIEPGYDGVFGQVRIWGLEKEREEGGKVQEKKAEEQMTLF
jgi:PHP family Zn ribbon phosphoesterase